MASRTVTEADGSVVQECYRLCVGQFGESREDQQRNAAVWMSIATAFLSFVAATSALLVSLQFWAVSLLLAVAGVGVLTFGWSVAVGRFDRLFEGAPPAL